MTPGSHWDEAREQFLRPPNYQPMPPIMPARFFGYAQPTSLVRTPFDDAVERGRSRYMAAIREVRTMGFRGRECDRMARLLIQVRGVLS